MLNYEVHEIPFTKEVGEFIALHHYSKTYSRSVLHCFGLYLEEVLTGVCTFSTFSREESARKFPHDLELSRFVLIPGCPKNTASFFLGRCLREMKDKTKLFGIVSYADPTEGHTGTIYQATNFQKIGVTQASRHYLNPQGERLHKKKVWRDALALNLSEKAFADAQGLTRIEELPKHVYRYELRVSDAPNYGVIYKIRNSINQKVYVGMTTQSLRRRFTRHLTDAKNGSALPFHAAIRALGAENFQVEMIDEAQTLKDLQEREAHWIEHFKSYQRELGYNVSRGYDSTSYVIPDSVFFDSLELRRQGVPITEIAERFGVSYDYLCSVQRGQIRPHILQKHEQDFGPVERPRIFSTANKLKIFQLFKASKSAPEIAKQLETSRTYVYKILKGEIDPDIKEIFEKEYGVVDVLSRVWTREENLELLTDYITKKLPLEEVQEKYGIQEVTGRVSLLRDTPLFAEWSKGTEQERDYTKIPAETLLELFKLKANGVPTKVLAEQFQINLNWINIILRGEARPEIKKLWEASGGGAPVKARPLREACRIASDRICFYTPKDAADFYGVTSAAILKSVKKGTKCKGVHFYYLSVQSE